MGLTKGQLRRLGLRDPDGSAEKREVPDDPKEMKLTDSKLRIYEQEDTNLVQVLDSLHDVDGEYLAVHIDVGTQSGGRIFFGTPRSLAKLMLSRTRSLLPRERSSG